MKGERIGENITYQWALRAVGAYLDEQQATSVSVIETPHGLAVRYLLDQQSIAFRCEHLDFERLMNFKRALEERRAETRYEASPGLDAIPLPGFTVGATYQDFFRALGWELDDMNGYNIVIDEVDDGMLVTYLCFDPAGGYVWQKRMANLRAGDKRAIMTEAYSRRRPRTAQTRDVREMVKLIG